MKNLRELKLHSFVFVLLNMIYYYRESIEIYLLQDGGLGLQLHVGGVALFERVDDG